MKKERRKLQSVSASLRENDEVDRKKKLTCFYDVRLGDSSITLRAVSDHRVEGKDTEKMPLPKKTVRVL